MIPVKDNDLDTLAIVPRENFLTKFSLVKCKANIVIFCLARLIMISEISTQAIVPRGSSLSKFSSAWAKINSDH